MKLVVAVVNDKDAFASMEDLVENDFQVTKLASTGGFLREGNTTLLIGINDEDIDSVIDILRRNCQTRKKTITPTIPMGDYLDASVAFPTEIQVGGAIVFILNVERQEKL